MYISRSIPYPIRILRTLGTQIGVHRPEALATITWDLPRNAYSQAPLQIPELFVTMLKLGKHCHKILSKPQNYFIPSPQK